MRRCDNSLDTCMLRRFEQPEIPIVISLGAGTACSRVWTCDLTHEYVTINGDYRT